MTAIILYDCMYVYILSMSVPFEHHHIAEFIQGLIALAINKTGLHIYPIRSTTCHGVGCRVYCQTTTPSVQGKVKIYSVMRFSG